jgi:hypothetical protein
MKKSARFLLVTLLVASSNITLWPQEKVDLEMITRIRYEGFRNSKVMEIASGLMDGIGPRLTGSPNMKRANEWTRDQLTSFGLSNAHLESWGPFGRGWFNEYINVRMTSPDVAPLIAYAKGLDTGHERRIEGQVYSRADRKQKGLRQVPRQVSGTDRHLRPRSRSEDHHTAPVRATGRQGTVRDRPISSPQRKAGLSFSAVHQAHAVHQRREQIPG